MDWFTLVIPKPPSVNRFTTRLGNKSSKVKAWIRQADNYLVVAGKWPRISGAYELRVQFPVSEFGGYDPDNRLKALCDWLQRVEIIQNDCMAAEINVRWGREVHEGFCQVSVRACEVPV